MVNCNKSNLYRPAINIFLYYLDKLGRFCMASVLLVRLTLRCEAPVSTINKINIAA